MNYIDYDYYTNEYCHGEEIKVTASVFPKYLKKAQSIVDLHTSGQLKDADEIPECVKNCCCELIESEYHTDELVDNSNGISSEKIKNYSVNYESTGSLETTREQKAKQIVYKWLSGTGLLYRGC